MPELPEVETTRRGLEPLLLNKTLLRFTSRVAKLRWPIAADLGKVLPGQQVLAVERRAKYLLLRLTRGTLLLHLGMSGNLRVVPCGTPVEKHDHIDIELQGGEVLRFRDPRKFGALLWLDRDPEHHPLLVELGPEPLAAEMNGAYLHRRSRGRKLAVKPFIMDQKIVVGVGNIYASEALFRAGLRPDRPAGEIGLEAYRRLAAEIEEVLREAIAAGGTTLQDFQQSDGRPGYFRQELRVYGRGGEPCTVCGRPIAEMRLGQRSSFFCRRCQK